LLACAAFFWRGFVLFGFDVFQNCAEMFVLGDRGMGNALILVEN
jgi:hypothetical protein